MRQLPKVLRLDIAGNPVEWITYEAYAYYFAKDLIGWSMGDLDVDVFGGKSRMTGEQTIMPMNTIVAIKGKVNERQMRQNRRVPLTNPALFKRDLNICAYCGDHFTDRQLTKDHIHPVSKGGLDIWTNVVASCAPCNQGRKQDKSLEEAGMQLLYVPYAPNKAELLILKNRSILADQMDFLIKQVPKNSRIHLM